MQTIDFTYTLCEGIDLEVSAEIDSEDHPNYSVFDYEALLNGDPVDVSGLWFRPFAKVDLKSVHDDIHDKALEAFFEEIAA